MSQSIKEVLAKHMLWTRGEGGDRAYLAGANLDGANLAGAYLARANLDGAYLARATGIMQATCSWSDHGRSGRQLVAVYQYAHGDRPASLVYHCGCFRGTESELRAGIAAGKWDDGDVTPERIGKLRKSRTVAVDFVSARMGEMLSDRGLAA